MALRVRSQKKQGHGDKKERGAQNQAVQLRPCAWLSVRVGDQESMGSTSGSHAASGEHKRIVRRY